MQSLTTYGRKAPFLLVIGFVLMLAACSTGQTTATGDQYGGSTTSSKSPAATATQAPSSSDTQGSSNDQGPVGSITYASVNITITGTDQQSTYTDDDYSTTPILFRVKTHEQNPTADTAYLYYSDAFRLILPGNKSVAPTKEGASDGIQQAVVRDNWLDFPVDSKQDVNKLVLLIGTPTENQISVPLSAHPDLSKYQARSITPGSKIKYGADWTVTKVTSSLSAYDKQALTGKRYIIVDFQVDNNTSDTFYPYATDNIRLKSSSATQSAEKSTLPGDFAANTTGGTGSMAFLMPQGETDLQLEFLAQPDNHLNATSVSFKI